MLSTWELQMMALLLEPEIWLRQLFVSVLILGFIWIGYKHL